MEIFLRVLMLLNRMVIANTHSTLFSAAKTNRPMPKPMGNVTPGALNFSQASKKLMAHTNPIQVKVQMTAMGCCTFNSFWVLRITYSVMRFFTENSKLNTASLKQWFCLVIAVIFYLVHKHLCHPISTPFGIGGFFSCKKFINRTMP